MQVLQCFATHSELETEFRSRRWRSFNTARREGQTVAGDHLTLAVIGTPEDLNRVRGRRFDLVLVGRIDPDLGRAVRLCERREVFPILRETKGLRTMNKGAFHIEGGNYDAFPQGEYEGTTTWMVRRYDSGADQGYRECLFSADTKDPHKAIEIAIAHDTWN